MVLQKSVGRPGRVERKMDESTGRRDCEAANERNNIEANIRQKVDSKMHQQYA